MVRWIATAAICFALAACGPPTSGTNWKMVGQITDSPGTYFVEITDGFEKDKSVYSSAVQSICIDTWCRILFIKTGDNRPIQSSIRDFEKAGAFGSVPSLAVWSGQRSSPDGDFVMWDCDRAGVEGAPIGALCGEGVREDHSAVLTLAGSATMEDACRWPKTDNAEITRQFINKVQDPARKNQYQEGFQLLYGNGHKAPDRISECANIQKRNAPAVAMARKRLLEAIAKNRR